LRARRPCCVLSSRRKRWFGADRPGESGAPPPPVKGFDGTPFYIGRGQRYVQSRPMAAVRKGATIRKDLTKRSWPEPGHRAEPFLCIRHHLIPSFTFP